MDWEDFLAEALGNRVRVRVIKYLFQRGGANLSRISRDLGLSYTSAKNNLRVLVSIGVLNEVEVGRVKIYKLSDSPSVRKLVKCVIGWPDDVLSH